MMIIINIITITAIVILNREKCVFDLYFHRLFFFRNSERWLGTTSDIVVVVVVVR